MTEPRGKVEKKGFHPGLEHFLEISQITVAAWCPDECAQQPPEQVHLIIEIEDLEDYPMAVRFKSPDTLAFLIEEMVTYRRTVWPDAPPLDIHLNELR